MYKLLTGFLDGITDFQKSILESSNIYEFLISFLKYAKKDEEADFIFLDDKGQYKFYFGIFETELLENRDFIANIRKKREYFCLKIEDKFFLLFLIKESTYLIVKTNQKIFEKEMAYFMSGLNEIIKVYNLFQTPFHSREKIRKLVSNEEMYRSVFENTGTGTIIIDYEMLILYANQKFCQLTGYKKEELENLKKWASFVYDDDREKMQSYHFGRRHGEKNVPEEYECRVVDKEGQLKYIYMKVGMIPGTDRSIASFMDITHRKEAELKLRERESQLSVIFENFDGLIYIVNEFYEIEFMNKALEKRGNMDTAGKCFNFLHGFETPCPWCGIKRALDGEIVKEEIFSPYDNKWYSYVSSPLNNSFGKITKAQTILMDITERKLSEKKLKENAESLKNENIKLKSSIKERYRLGNIIGKSLKMQDVYELILKAAESEAHIIVYGESGTGKELVAQEIHRLSKRHDKNFVPVNCGAISEKLIESEFFGYKKGAFTGAGADKQGFLDKADKGTLFLDEIGEINLNMQVKLLRVIDDAGYTPVGGIDVKRPNLRIIAATNRNLKELVKERHMREDFFYRIHVIPIKLPPLRERKDDIPLLIDHFIGAMKFENPPSIPGRLMDSFMKYSWPGNIRELQNVINRYLAIGDPGALSGFDVEPEEDTNSAFIDFSMPLADIVADFEASVITKALDKNRWQKKRTADYLGVHRKTLFQKIKKYGIE